MAKPQVFDRNMRRLAYLDNALAVGYALETNSLWSATFTLPADDKKKIFSGVSVAASAWASDSTYAAYPYAASIACSGVTASHVPEVVFGATEAASGNFAPVALSGSGTVKIYAATKPTAAITVQSITCIKAVS